MDERYIPLNPRVDYIFVSPRITVDQARVLPHMHQAKAAGTRSQSLGARGSRRQKMPWAYELRASRPRFQVVAHLIVGSCA